MNIILCNEKVRKNGCTAQPTFVLDNSKNKTAVTLYLCTVKSNKMNCVSVKLDEVKKRMGWW